MQIPSLRLYAVGANALTFCAAEPIAAAARTNEIQTGDSAMKRIALLLPLLVLLGCEVKIDRDPDIEYLLMHGIPGRYVEVGRDERCLQDLLPESARAQRTGRQRACTRRSSRNRVYCRRPVVTLLGDQLVAPNTQ